MSKILSVTLSDQTAADLDAFSKETGCSRSDIVKELLSIFLWEARLKEVRLRCVKKAKATGVVTEEDVLRIGS